MLRLVRAIPLGSSTIRSVATPVASLSRQCMRSYSSEVDPELKKEREQHIKQLEKYYPPSLVKSIIATESMVTPEMWQNKKQNIGEFGPFYADDYAKYDPLYDFPQHEWVDKTKPWQPIPQQIPPGVSLKPDEYSGARGKGINISKLEQLTGLSASYIKSLTMRQITRKRVVNMTRKGKQPSTYSLVIVGDQNGHVGIGEGKNAQQPAKAMEQAYWNAIKNLVYIPRFENRTIYGKINHKYHAVLLELRAAPPGSGLRVNHIIYEICKCAGIKDLVGNVGRSRNPMNVAKATIEALSTKQSSLEEIAASRGKRIVDVTKAYYNF